MLFRIILSTNMNRQKKENGMFDTAKVKRLWKMLRYRYRPGKHSRTKRAELDQTCISGHSCTIYLPEKLQCFPVEYVCRYENLFPRTFHHISIGEKYGTHHSFGTGLTLYCLIRCSRQVWDLISVHVCMATVLRRHVDFMRCCYFVFSLKLSVSVA